MAPGTTSAGPWSEPIASTAMRTPPPSLDRRAVIGGRSSGRRRFVLRRLQLEDRPAAVEAAVRTRAVSPLGLVAVRALLERGQAEREMRSPVALTGMGNLSLRHAHRVVGLLS